MAAKPFPTLADLTSDQIATHAREAGEPDWLVAWRTEAWNVFAQSTPPEWRRTNLDGLQPETIQPLPHPQGTAIQWDDSLASSGVVFTSLAAAMRTHEHLVRERLGSAIDPHTHKFRALRAALWQDGALLYVPRNVVLEHPLRVCYTLADGSSAIFPYTLVILEAGARATLIEEYTSRDSAEPALAGPTTEMFLGEGSDLRFVSLQQWGANVYHLGAQTQVFGNQASSEWVSLALGGQTQHIEAEAHLQGDGSCITWHGATFASQKQQLLTAPSLRHTGAHTESHLDFKTIVTDEAYSVFDGMIRIAHESRGTTTRLEEHALHLSPSARSDSIPGLKIDTNDVASAGHASTSGQIDEEHLFYMQSRGIDKDEAKRLIVLGFFEPVLNALPQEDMREALTATLEARI